MWPVLFEFPLPWGDPGSAFPIRMFGIMVILGFLSGTWVIARRLKRRGVLAPQDTFDFCFYLLATGILGSRLMYVAQNFDQFKGRFFSLFKIWEGGLVWYGGFALAALFAFWWLWKRKLKILEVTDAVTIGLALALAIGRWGCFCAGDDYGAPILADDGSIQTLKDAVPWYAVQFPTIDAGWRFKYSETPHDFRSPVWLHPVQIYMSISNLAVFGGLLLVARKAKRLGTVTGCYFLFYAVARFIVEFWRGDVDRGLYGNPDGWQVSFSQLFGIPVFLLGLLVLKISRSTTPKPPPAAPPPG